KYIPKFCKALDLDKKESEYFSLMVHYTHTTHDHEKQNIFDKMVSYLPKKIQRLKKTQQGFYENWYYVAIHQALSVINFKDNYQELAQFIQPSIRVPDAKHAIKLLEELQLIQQDKNGFYRPTETAMVGGEEVGALVIKTFQNQMMDMAKKSQFTYTPEQRHVFTQTLSTSMCGWNRIKYKLQQFQQEIIEIVRSEEEEEQVFQLNVQMFPMSQMKADKE
ncbi:MAG: TIGR02147 family protein, partial [Fibrobacteria bacterium]|nr:TIGR02147 family protein [Fibrobacteria bacterium]